MRRNGQPSRPNAITCCCFSSVKTLLTSSEGISLPSRFNVLPYFRWPVFRCPSLAGFGCPPRNSQGAVVQTLFLGSGQQVWDPPRDVASNPELAGKDAFGKT